jgi:hypothetical protein
MDAVAFEELARTYLQLERDLQHLFAATIGASCAQCALSCCRADLCDETCGSLFLDEVRRVAQVPPQPTYSDRDGWLGTRGCRLEVGRPPVCYAFVCEELYEALPTAVEAALREVCGELDSLCSEVDHGVDLHALGPDAWAHMDGDGLNSRMQALNARCEVLLAQLLGGAA